MEEKEKIQKQIENNNKEIEKISDVFDSKRNNLKLENMTLQGRLIKLEEIEKEKIEKATLFELGMSFQEAVKFLQERGIEIILT